MAENRLLYLSQADVVAAGLSMAEIIDAMEAAFRAKGEGRTEMPPKPGVHPGGGNNFIHAMPAYIEDLKSAGVKWVSGYPENHKRGLPYITGLLIYNDVATGLPLAVMDCVFFGRTKGYLVVRDPHKKQNVYCSEIECESLAEYVCATDTLVFLGYEILAVVVDGKRGLTGHYADRPVQMCHFHQLAATRRYLTLRPRLEAGMELRDVARKLSDCCETCFARKLSQWYEKWRGFIAEKTMNPMTGKWHYTHRRLRSAYFSLKRSLPYLYAYQRHPEL